MNTKSASGFWLPFGVALLGVALVGWLGAGATDIGPWYNSLKKPSWQPPNWLFGPVWSTLYLLMAISAALGWRSAGDNGRAALIVILFVVNGALNVFWSFLFFAQKRPDIALIEIVALWLSIVVLIVVLWPRSRTAAVLLTPYLAWVSFATLLNATIVSLN
jgi:translocator protein